MEKIKESELILNSDGSIYHLKLRPEQIADTIIIAGDPGRVAAISSHFDQLEHIVQNREFVTHTGYYNHRRISALSTGIGTDNIDIVLNELDALVNIDLETREVRPNLKSLDIIRFGTSGALQGDIPVDTVVMSKYGLGFDGLLHYYQHKPELFNEDMTDAFIRHTGWKNALPRPYIVEASPKLSERLGKNLRQGITATATGFYGPQGRVLRLPLSHPQLNEKIETFEFNNYRITNFEMETSALYGLGALLGHNTLTLGVIIANRIAKTFTRDYKKTIENVAGFILDSLTS